MNEKKMIIDRISKYKRKMTWHVKRLKKYIAILDGELSIKTLYIDDLNDLDENEILEIIEERVSIYEKRIMDYEKRIAWNTKRLAKCQNVKVAP